MKSPLKRHVEMERLFGSDFLPVTRSGRKPPPVVRPALVAKPPAAKKGTAPVHPWEKDYPAEFLEFREQVLACEKCALCSSRTQVVFGVGPHTAPLLFVGEAPGEDEDRKGEPFVGRAGQLLTSTLKKIGVERSRVFIANILKCRPPGNRTPQFDEMAACMPWLQQQIRTIKPKLLCALGNIAAQTLLNTKTGITRLRGKTMMDAAGNTIFPTFHPAYILRNMSDLPLFESDLRQVAKLAGLV